MKKLLFPLCHIFRTIRAMLLYGIRRVIVGENKTFMGEEELLRSRGVSVEVIHDETCIALMRDFIAPGRNCGTRISASSTRSTGKNNEKRRRAPKLPQKLIF